MENVLEESGFETPGGNGCHGATHLGEEIKVTAKRLEKDLKESSAAVLARLEDGAVAAQRLLKRSRYAATDCVDDTAHQIKSYPFRSITVALAAGVALGFLAAYLRRK